MTASDVAFILLAGFLPMVWFAHRLGRNRALALGDAATLHSQPGQYGWYVVLGLALPALIVAVIGAVLTLTGVYHVPSVMLVTAALVVAAGGLSLALRYIRADLPARNIVESSIFWALRLASMISILTTVGILLSVIFEAIEFFHIVGFWNFMTGTEWNPDTAFLQGAGRGHEDVAQAHFGSVPIFAGTFMITGIAMLVAIPVGLYSAIFMSEYASHSVRGWLKPALEILAGIPTVVYGFFAAITISPIVVQTAEFLGLEADATNALAPGVVMGVMIIPFISSLSDDVLRAVPQALREGSLAMGITKAETIRHIVIPAALPGIVSASLLGVSRAIGETMIVVMAAGLRPNLTWNPLEGMTTVTVRIVDALTGDQEFNSPLTLSAFGLGLVLLVLTMLLNLISLTVIRRFRLKYE
ncbi:MAG: phosphate ABC transporter permease subunit PstC [Gammaproteobacteria bacterium]|nr:phosphate ABC transporter permease subunit PstC [Gammaproteobacteria bacterium]